MEMIHILFLEDNPDDVELMEFELKEAGINYISKRVDGRNDFIKEAAYFDPDLVLADYSLSMFNGMQAFRILKEVNNAVPFILVTGVLSEKLALECLKEGVDDFILKSSFKRLPTAIVNAIEKRNAEKEKDRMASELKKSHEELRLLVNRHQNSIEEERLNIARDLHDELGQVLTALKIDVAMLRKKIVSGKTFDEHAVRNEFTLISKTIDKIANSVRQISSGLRPEVLDDLGILEAIHCHAAEFEKRSKIRCELYLPAEVPLISKELAIALFRIIQESLTNVARHSMATVVRISLAWEFKTITLEIVDNGRGIDSDQISSSKSLGIISLRERVQLLHGKFSIGKAGNGGTRVYMSIPSQ